MHSLSSQGQLDAERIYDYDEGKCLRSAFERLQVGPDGDTRRREVIERFRAYVAVLLPPLPGAHKVPPNEKARGRTKFLEQIKVLDHSEPLCQGARRLKLSRRTAEQLLRERDRPIPSIEAKAFCRIIAATLAIFHKEAVREELNSTITLAKCGLALIDFTLPRAFRALQADLAEPFPIEPTQGYILWDSMAREAVGALIPPGNPLWIIGPSGYGKNAFIELLANQIGGSLPKGRCIRIKSTSFLEGIHSGMYRISDLIQGFLREVAEEVSALPEEDLQSKSKVSINKLASSGSLAELGIVVNRCLIPDLVFYLVIERFDDLFFGNGAPQDPKAPEVFRVLLQELLEAAVGAQFGSSDWKDRFRLVITSSLPAHYFRLGEAFKEEKCVFLEKFQPSKERLYKIPKEIDEAVFNKVTELVVGHPYLVATAIRLLSEGRKLSTVSGHDIKLACRDAIAQFNKKISAQLRADPSLYEAICDYIPNRIKDDDTIYIPNTSTCAKLMRLGMVVETPNSAPVPVWQVNRDPPFASLLPSSTRNRSVEKEQGVM